MAKKKQKSIKGIPGIQEETLLWQQSGVFVFGVDEAGRGCLAGPVCAAVSCWAPFSLFPQSSLPVSVRDSKLMTEHQREHCFEPVRALSLTYGVGMGSSTEIDRWNILKANYLAVARALESALLRMPAWRSANGICFLTDGNHPLVTKSRFFVESSEYRKEFPLVNELFRQGFEEKCIVKGDTKIFSIAAASILAKVSRDRLMCELGQRFPAYEFATHKGYSTPQHVAILRKVGPCSEHRRSFAPVSESLDLFSAV